MSRILITGATGLLGSYLLKTAAPEDVIYSTRFDILDRAAVYRAFDEAKPEVVIHCAGEGRVDFAEENRCAAWQSTYEGLENVTRACHYWGAHIVFVSSNSVYNGKQSPSNEETLHDPLHTYGKYKSTCEGILTGYAFKRSIIRPILLYGWPNAGRRDNMVTRLIRDLQTRDLGSCARIPVADDIISQPTYAYDCATAIWKYIRMNDLQEDFLNIAPKEKMSLFKFAVEVAKAWDCDPELLVPVSSSEMKGFAPRPRDTTFDTSKLDRLGITLDNPAQGLLRMKAEPHVS